MTLAETQALFHAFVHVRSHGEHSRAAKLIAMNTGSGL